MTHAEEVLLGHVIEYSLQKHTYDLATFVVFDELVAD